jgi:hypothetical protein
MTVLQLAALLSALSVILAIFGIWTLAQHPSPSPRRILVVVSIASLPAVGALCLMFMRQVVLAGSVG